MVGVVVSSRERGGASGCGMVEEQQKRTGRGRCVEVEDQTAHWAR